MSDSFWPTGAKPLTDLFLAKLADSLNASDTEVSEVTKETVTGVLDILLSIGGPTAWAMAGADYMGKVSEETAAKLRGLGFIELIGKDGKSRWELSSPEAEIRFLTTWLAEADSEGRVIEPEWVRQGIEKWIEYNQNQIKPKSWRNGHSCAPVQSDVEGYPYPEEQVPYADESRAKEAREAAKRPATRTQEDVQASLERRRQRLGR
jgi:hypothetical protein